MVTLVNNTFLSPSQIANINNILGGEDEFDPLAGTELQRLLDELAEQQAANDEDGSSVVPTFRTRDGSDLSTQNLDDETHLAQAVADLQARNGSNLGLLGYDVNGNGAIDNEGELFGFDDGDPTTAELSGSTDLTVTGATDGTALTFTNVTASDSDSDGIAPTLSVSEITAAVTAVREERAIAVGATVEVGDTFSIELDGSGPISYTATTTNPDDVAAGLATAINDFYGNDASLINATSSGSTLTVQGDATGASFTLDSLSTTNAATIAQQDTLDVFQVANGDSFTTTVNGFDFTVVTGGADDEDTIRDALVAAINASADVNGDVIAAPTANAGEFTITAQNAGTPFTLSTSTIDGGGGSAQAVNITNTTANQAEGTDLTQSLTDDGITVQGVEQVAGVYEVQVGGTVETGDVLTLDVSDGTGTTNISITAGGADDNTTIAAQISAAIDGSLTGVTSTATGQTIDDLLASGSLDEDRLFILSANGTNQQVTQYYAEVQNNVSTVAKGQFVLDDGSNKAGIVVDLTL